MIHITLKSSLNLEAEDMGSISTLTSLPPSSSGAKCHIIRPHKSYTFCLWTLLDFSHKLKTCSAWFGVWHRENAPKYLSENLTHCYCKNQNPPSDFHTFQAPQKYSPMPTLNIISSCPLTLQATASSVSFFRTFWHRFSSNSCHFSSSLASQELQSCDLSHLIETHTLHSRS